MNRGRQQGRGPLGGVGQGEGGTRPTVVGERRNPSVPACVRACGCGCVEGRKRTQGSSKRVEREREGRQRAAGHPKPRIFKIHLTSQTCLSGGKGWEAGWRSGRAGPDQPKSPNLARGNRADTKGWSPGPVRSILSWARIRSGPDKDPSTSPRLQVPASPTPGLCLTTPRRPCVGGRRRLPSQRERLLFCWTRP